MLFRSQRILAAAKKPLVTQSEAGNEVLVPGKIFILKIGKKLSPLSHELEKPSAGMEILFMDLHVFRKLPNTMGKYRHLDFRGTRIGSVHSILLDDFLFFFFGNHIQHSS